MNETCMMLLWQIQDSEAQQVAVTAELSTLRKAVADDNEEIVTKGVKGVSAAQELISKFCCWLLEIVHWIANTICYHCCLIKANCKITLCGQSTFLVYIWLYILLVHFFTLLSWDDMTL